jgi:hypothetical protein
LSGEQPVPMQAARPGSRRRVVAAGVVIAGALILIAATAWYGRGSVAPEVTATPTAVAVRSTGPPSPTLAVLPTPAVPTVVWQAAAPADAFQGLATGPLAKGVDGYVALAVDRLTGSPAVLTSAEGTSWLRQPEPPELFGGGMPDVLTAGPDGYVALGWEVSAARGVTRVMWISPDGASWTRDPMPSADVGLITAPDLLSGFGHYLLFDGGSTVPLVLVSADGSTWATVPPTTFGPQASVSAIVAGPTGFVAAGSGAAGVAIWTSADGNDWTLVPDLPAGFATQGPPDQLVAGPTGVTVHVGGNASGNMSIWSPDDRAWSARVAADAPTLPSQLAGLPLARSSAYQRLTGLLYAAPPAGDADSGWLSADGIGWAQIKGTTFSDDVAVSVAGDGGTHLVVVASDDAGVNVYLGALSTASTVPTSPSPSPSAGPPLGSGPAPGADALAAWQQVTGTPIADASADSTMTGAARLGTGVVAVGARGDRPSAWFSPDGRSWQAAPVQASLAPGSLLLKVASSGHLAVATGSVLARDGSQQTRSWTSTDGLHWTLQPVAPDLAGAFVQDLRFLDGRWYAVGQLTAGDASSSPAIWTSVDGSHWAVARDAAFASLPLGVPIQGITSSGSRLLAWEVYGDGAVAILRSSDGRAWVRVRDPAVMTPTPLAPEYTVEALAIEGGPAGYLAMGSLYPLNKVSPPAAAVWTSADGIAWTAVPTDASLVGAETTVGLRWLDGHFVAFGQQTWPEAGMAGLWTSPDGAHWKRISGAGLTGTDPTVVGSWIAGVVAGPDGAVAVGFRRVVPVPVAGQRTEASVWLGGPMTAPLPGAPCPAATPSVGVLALMGAGDRWACYAGRTMTLRGYVAPPANGCGGARIVGPPDGAAADRYAATCGEDGDGLLASATDETTPTSISLVGPPLQHAVVPGWYDVTGRFGGPSFACAQPIAQGSPLEPLEPPLADALPCLEAFTVTAMTPVRGP